MKLDARIALLKNLDIEAEITYHDYKKFRTDAKIVPVGEAQNEHKTGRFYPYLQHHSEKKDPETPVFACQTLRARTPRRHNFFCGNLMTLWKTMGVLLLYGPSCCEAATNENAVIQRLQILGTQRPLKLETQVGDVLDQRRIARDVHRAWGTGWFEDIRVEVSREQDAVQLVFHLAEKPRYYLRRIVFEPASLQHPVRIEPGAPLNKLICHRVAADVRSRLVEEGYKDAEVQSEIVAVGLRQADLRLRLRPGPQYRVQEIRFWGTLGLDKDVLLQAMRSTRARRVLPGLPGVWNGWRWHSRFSERRVEASLQSLRSFYFSQGYWGAVVTLASIDFAGNQATLSIAVDSGPRYRITQAQIGEQVILPLNHSTVVPELCRCLRQVQSQAEKEGKLDFSFEMEVREAERLGSDSAGRSSRNELTGMRKDDRELSLNVKAETGASYWVGRIEFRGNHRFSELTLRRMLLLNEGDLFDYGQLRRSLARLNRLGFFQAVTEENVQFFRHPLTGYVDLTLELKERPRGYWSLSGSAEPLSLFRPLPFSVATRLLNWGNGRLELSTYLASLTLFPLVSPMTPVFLLAPVPRWQPLIAVGRPSLPGQPWRSGFLFLPQAGWRATLAASGLVQARGALLALKDNDISAGELAVPVWRGMKENENDIPRAKFTGTLLCGKAKPQLSWPRSIVASVLDWVLAMPTF